MYKLVKICEKNHDYTKHHYKFAASTSLFGIIVFIITDTLDKKYDYRYGSLFENTSSRRLHIIFPCVLNLLAFFYLYHKK